MKIIYLFSLLSLLFFSSCSIIGIGIARSMDDNDYHDITNIDSLRQINSSTKLKVSLTDGKTYRGTFENFIELRDIKIDSSSSQSNLFEDTNPKKHHWELSIRVDKNVWSLKDIEIQKIEKYNSSGMSSGAIIVGLGIVVDLWLVYRSTNSSLFNPGG